VEESREGKGEVRDKGRGGGTKGREEKEETRSGNERIVGAVYGRIGPL
jgi:hypothetical protein